VPRYTNECRRRSASGAATLTVRAVQRRAWRRQLRFPSFPIDLTVPTATISDCDNLSPERLPVLRGECHGTGLPSLDLADPAVSRKRRSSDAVSHQSAVEPPSPKPLQSCRTSRATYEDLDQVRHEFLIIQEARWRSRQGQFVAIRHGATVSIRPLDSSAPVRPVATFRIRRPCRRPLASAIAWCRRQRDGRTAPIPCEGWYRGAV
jgi:hypothetical protein